MSEREAGGADADGSGRGRECTTRNKNPTPKCGEKANAKASAWTAKK